MGLLNFKVKTGSKTEFIDITAQVNSMILKEKINDGICLVYIPHTTCGITINEAADPDVQRDILKELNKIVPFNDNYAHIEGNSAAHIKASLIGSSISIPISNSRSVLGTWQGIFLCEFDGPRERSVYLQIIT